MRMKEFKVEPVKDDKKLFDQIEKIKREASEKASNNKHLLGSKNNEQNDNSMEKLVRMIEELVFNDSEKNEQKSLEVKSLKNKFAAIVLDRFFFFISIFYTLVTLIGIVMTLPNFSPNR